MKAIPSHGVAPGVEPAHVQLRKARREAGLSQNEVARRMGMDVLEYCRLESGCGEGEESMIHKVTAYFLGKEPASK